MPEQSTDLFKKVMELEGRLKVIEEKQGLGEAAEEYPEYVSGKWYYNGNKMTFNGAKYECVAPEGVVCVWNPEEHPSYWKLVE
jgi:hypothetical protein